MKDETLIEMFFFTMKNIRLNYSKSLKSLFIINFCNNFVIFISLSDYLTDEAEGREENAGPKNCICNGPSCICCLDFNISLIDLGGPGKLIENLYEIFHCVMIPQ